MENQISTEDKESNPTLTFKNSSFPDITLDCYDNLNFLHLSNKCQTILKSITNEIDEISMEKKLKEAFNNDNTNYELIKKIKEKKDNQNLDNLIEIYNPLFKYDFKNKLFYLIKLLQKYNKKEILLKYEINEIINNDYNELKDLINQFNKEINIENEKFIYMIIYYNWISNLIYKIYYYKNKTEVNYISFKEIKKNESEFYSKNYLNSLNYLNQKISDLNDNVKKYLQLDNIKDNKSLLDIIEQKINHEKINEIMLMYKNNNNFINYEDVKNEKIKELLKFKFELNKYLKCLDSISDFFTNFYEIYLDFLNEFLKNIPKTLNNLFELKYNDINILDDFIFFLSHYDFETLGYSNLIDYYEKTFEELKDVGEDCEIKNNNLILYNQIIIENYKNYNLNWCDFRKIIKMKFKYEKYVKFSLISQESLFCKYKDTYLKFFKKLFLDDRSCIKKLFINTFPILKNNYFINDELLEYIFYKKIHIFNFESKEFAGETNSYTFNIYIKSNFENNDDTIEVQICFYVAYIIILIHEISHFIRLYIYKYTGKKEYENSFDFDDETNTDIGFFIEKNLFGRVVGEINLLEAFYLLDIDNYYKDINIFLKNFSKLKKNNDKFDINAINDNVKNFLNDVDIKNLFNLKTLDINSKLLIKGIGGNFFIGKNNDRFHFPQFIEEANKYLSKIMS